MVLDVPKGPGGALGMAGTLGYPRLYGEDLVTLTCIWDPEPSLTPSLPGRV